MSLMETVREPSTADAPSTSPREDAVEMLAKTRRLYASSNDRVAELFLAIESRSSEEPGEDIDALRADVHALDFELTAIAESLLLNVGAVVGGITAVHQSSNLNQRLRAARTANIGNDETVEIAALRIQSESLVAVADGDDVFLRGFVDGLREQFDAYVARVAALGAFEERLGELLPSGLEV